MNSATLDQVYRSDARRVFATLVRLLGNFDLAEEALHDAFLAAAEHWPREGLPANPVAWLVSAGRFRAIDQLRRQKRFTPWDEALDNVADDNACTEPGEELEDDRLRLIFTCCHPSLSEEARIALTLREVCGLSTEQVASACLVPAPTLAQRIVRAKGKIRDARIPYQVPGPDELPARLPGVLRVIYLVFNEGYSASSGDNVLRPDLSTEALRLGRLLHELLPEPEVSGLLALMLLQESRRAARVDAAGDLVPLDEQDRGQWDRALIDEGCGLVRRALLSRRFGTYTLQAAIAAVHAEAAAARDTDWNEIVGLYDALLRREPAPVIALNRAVAVAMRDGPAAGLALIEPLLADEALRRYHLAWAARAELYSRLGDKVQAREAWEAALALAKQEPERRFLRQRLARMEE
ncbi:RNA polymerase sigma factor [Massilia terrae]|uniref:RNA polymerase sigma factor n=1 Tax=Massilia terrae TaxID=1811224 RepID=A0ABT2D0P4_9BURK|nr:RNA polymerase sigma factor [Massilia terrae]MCS0659801.1 RNA polymerase sigma factor [Massilia terrae]